MHFCQLWKMKQFHNTETQSNCKNINSSFKNFWSTKWNKKFAKQKKYRITFVLYTMSKITINTVKLYIYHFYPSIKLVKANLITQIRSFHQAENLITHYLTLNHIKIIIIITISRAVPSLNIGLLQLSQSSTSFPHIPYDLITSALNLGHPTVLFSSRSLEDSSIIHIKLRTSADILKILLYYVSYTIY